MLEGEKVGLELHSAPVKIGDFTVADGAITATVPADATPGAHSLVLSHNGAEVGRLPFEVLAADSDPVEKPAISVEPKTVKLSDFLNQEKGALVTVTGLTPGAKYTIEVNGGTDVKGVTLTEKADADGVAAYRVYGLSKAQSKNYLGDYTVTLADPKLSTTFTVVADDDGGSDSEADEGRDSNAGGSHKKGGGSGSSQLPRTGAELTAAAVGGLLLTVGGAAVFITRRRRG